MFIYLFIYLLLCFSFYLFFLSCGVVVLYARDCSCVCSDVIYSEIEYASTLSVGV